jgi:O-antigen/teichoic acid export membrane protein
MNPLPSLRQLVARRQSALILPLDRPLPLRANFAWTFFGNGVYAASQWGMLAVMAKVGSPEMVGQFSLAVAIATPIIMFANLQLSVVQATDAKNLYRFSDYLGLRLASTCLAWLVIAGVAIVGGYRRETAWAILVVGLAKAFEAVSDIVYGLLQKHERMDRIATSKVIKGVFSLVVLGGLVWMTKSIVYGALGLAGVWLALLLTYDRGNARHFSSLRWYLGKDTTWPLIRLAFPMGVVMLLVSLSSNIPRYFVQHYHQEAELGYYAAMAYLMVVGNMVVSALGQSATPRLAQYYAAANGHAFRKLLFRLAGLGAALGVAGMVVVALWGRPILTLLYRPDYAAYADVLVWLMAAAGIGYVASFLGYGMSAARHFRIQAPLFAAVTVAVGLACLWLVPKNGLLGAAQATLVGSLVNLVGCVAVIAHASWLVDRRSKGLIPDAQ